MLVVKLRFFARLRRAQNDSAFLVLGEDVVGLGTEDVVGLELGRLRMWRTSGAGSRLGNALALYRKQEIVWRWTVS